MSSKKMLLSCVAAMSIGVGVLMAEDKPKPADQPATPAKADAKPAAEPAKKTTTASGLVITVVEEAKQPGAQAGDIVWVHYTGKLLNGEQFDSSVGGKPLKFTLGTGQVIKGWDEGVAGMKVGEKRNLVIPPELGYGAGGSGKIPPNATLVFDIEMLGLARPGPQQ
jgi:FKBP-type peptidyl-prolyl cis-trans isomerase